VIIDPTPTPTPSPQEPDPGNGIWLEEPDPGNSEDPEPQFTVGASEEEERSEDIKTQ